MVNDDLEITNNQIYEELIRTRQELKSFVEATEVKLLLKLEEINKKVNKLEKENKEIKAKIEILERKEKKNNVIIFGLKKEANIITPEAICNKLNQKLEINLKESDINNVYTLGNKDNSPLKVEFVAYLKKYSVIQNSFKLKGSEISIVHDLTTKQREENNTLRKHLHLARQNCTIKKSFIKQNKLHIDDCIFSVEDLIGVDDVTQYMTQKKPASAPTTPILIENTNHKQTKEQREIQDTPTKKTGAIKKPAKEVTNAKILRNRPLQIKP